MRFPFTSEEVASAGGALVVLSNQGGGFWTKWSASPEGLVHAALASKTFEGSRFVGAALGTEKQSKNVKDRLHQEDDLDCLIADLAEEGLVFHAAPVVPSYTAKFEPDEDGVWCVTADCGEHGTAITQGRTLDEARARTREAIACLLDVEEDAFDVVEELSAAEQGE